jgi:hypothetical protein
MSEPNLDKQIEHELEVSASLACYLAGLVDGTRLSDLEKARDALLSNYELITELQKALANKSRGKA